MQVWWKVRVYCVITLYLAPSTLDLNNKDQYEIFTNCELLRTLNQYTHNRNTPQNMNSIDEVDANMNFNLRTFDNTAKKRKDKSSLYMHNTNHLYVLIFRWIQIYFIEG